MRKLASLLLALSLVGTAAANEWVQLTATTIPLDVQVLDNAPSRIVMQCQINGFNREDFQLNDHTYTRVVLDREALTWKTGYPELPRLHRSLIIPDNARMTVRVVSSQYRDIPNVLIAPSKATS